MKYIIQLFSTSDPGSQVGHWSNTNWGGDDREAVLSRAQEIADTINKKKRSLHIAYVRVVESLVELAAKEHPKKKGFWAKFIETLRAYTANEEPRH